MTEQIGGLRAYYDRSTLDLSALLALAAEVARYPSYSVTGLVSSDALPQLQQTRTVIKDVQVPGLFRTRVERRQVTETVRVPDEAKQTFGWSLCHRHWSRAEKQRDKPGAYCAKMEKVTYALLKNGGLAVIVETWRERVLMGGPVYQRWDDEVRVRPMTGEDVIDLDHRLCSNKHNEGIRTWTSETFGSRLRDGVRVKGDQLRADLLHLAADEHRSRLATTYTNKPTRTSNADRPRTGVVKWFDPVKGFGFIALATGGDDLFFHVSAIEQASAGRVHAGVTVTYQVRNGKRGPVASNVRATD